MGNKIIGVIALYKPTEKDLNNIIKYVDQLDYCILMDDSGYDNKAIFLEIMKKYQGKIRYHLNEENCGLCVSVNKGFKIAIQLGANWILVMNPDGYFANDSIQIFKKYIANNDTSDVAILAPQFNFDRHPRTPHSGFKTIRYADMTGCLYNAAILKFLGYYDENTYFDGLDIEYCLRVKKNRCKIIECSEAVLNHHPAHTKDFKILNKRIFSYGIDSPVRYYYQFRSGYYIHKKHASLLNDLFMMYKYFKILFLFDNKNEYKKMVKKGIRDAKDGYYGKYRN